MSAAQANAVSLTGGFRPLAVELPALLRHWLGDWTEGELATGVSTTDGTAASHCALAAPTHDEGPAEAPSQAADPLDWADVQASLHGDGDGYARLVRRYQQDIGVYMWRFTRQRGAWEELVHDVFVEAYLGLASYKGRAPLLHWLKRIATRVGYRFWRRRERRRREGPLTEDATATLVCPDQQEAARQAGELAHRLLARLSPRDRLVMTLMYLEGCTTAEIAELTGWSQSMVKVQAHRARKRLRKTCEAMDMEL
jgi:RNA polymerase sigma-70 factor (ECF subfamily)